MFNTSTRARTRTHTHTYTTDKRIPKACEIAQKNHIKNKYFSLLLIKQNAGVKGCTIINLHEWVMNRVYFLQLKYNLTHAHTQVYAMNNC